MNVLFLIGNGFDLNLGLKTRFKDVLNSYLEEKTVDPRIEKFKADINKDIENWSDFEKQLGIYTEEYNTDNVDDFCFCIKHFKEHLIEYLKKEEKRIGYNLHKEEITKVFINSLFNFYNGLNPYSQGIFQNIFQNAKYSGQTITCNFITFNYTNVLDNCIKVMEQGNPLYNIGQTLHIHGSISKNPLVGVDNAEQIKNKDLVSNEKINNTIIKPIINKKLKNFNDTNAFSLIQNSNIICLFGLSLGETDKTWWKEIGYWLKTTNKQLIIFNIAESWNQIHADEEIENIDSIVNKFYSAANIPIAERNKIEDRIHIGLNTDLFNLNLVSPRFQTNNVVISRAIVK